MESSIVCFSLSLRGLIPAALSSVQTARSPSLPQYQLNNCQCRSHHVARAYPPAPSLGLQGVTKAPCPMCVQNCIKPNECLDFVCISFYTCGNWVQLLSRHLFRNLGRSANLALHPNPVDLPVVGHRTRSCQRVATTGACAGLRVSARWEARLTTAGCVAGLCRSAGLPWLASRHASTVALAEHVDAKRITGWSVDRACTIARPLVRAPCITRQIAQVSIVSMSCNAPSCATSVRGSDRAPVIEVT